MLRFGRLWFYGFAVMAAVVLTPVGLVAQGNSGGESAPKAEQRERLKMSFTVLRVGLGEEYQLGSELEQDEVTGMAAEGGVRALAKELRQFGDVELLYEGETMGLENSELSFFLGSEEPFMKTFFPNKDDDRTKVSSQQVVSSGLSAQFTPQRTGMSYEISYDVDMDFAMPVERDGMTMIGRQRMSWEGTTMLLEEEEVFMGRFIRSVSGQQSEFFFLLEVERIQPAGSETAG